MPLVREGQRPGTMDVDLQVEDQNPWTASVGLNNDYSADTENCAPSPASATTTFGSWGTAST